MKTFCALATLAAATAVENTAPVISLSLTGVDTTHGAAHGMDSEDHDLCGSDDAALAARNTDGATPSVCVEYDAHVTEAVKAAHASTVRTEHPKYSTSHPHSFAAKALVTATKEQFPEPTASAYDHHDESHVEIIKTYQYFVISRPACNTFSVAAPESLTSPTSFETADNALSAGTIVNTGTYVAGENQCAMAQTASDVNLVTDSAGEGDADLDDSKQSHFSQEMRNRRGEFIIKYDATDRAGNQASQLVFAMILTDDEPPCPVGPALEIVEAMDSCEAIEQYKEGGLTGAAAYGGNPPPTFVCADLTRAQIMLDEKKIYWIDNYDGTSPTMASADATVRAHGLSYTITQNTYEVKSATTGTTQPIYDMQDSTSVSLVGDTTVVYTTKDYANIFGTGYSDNSGTTATPSTLPADCVAPATEWTVKDSLPPRVFPNPNVDAVETGGAGAQGGTRVGGAGTDAGCGDVIPNHAAYAPGTASAGRNACHSWNLRRRWCSSALFATPIAADAYEASDRCVGWSMDAATYPNGALFRESAVSVGDNECHYEIGEHARDVNFQFSGVVHEDTADPTGAYGVHSDHDANAHHECGTTYREPGYVCIDVRDSYTNTAASGAWDMEILNVNILTDGTTRNFCNDYHVGTDICTMHQDITYSQGPTISNDAISSDVGGTSKAVVFGTVLDGAVNSATAYPLYGKDGACYTTLVAQYKCIDAMMSEASTFRNVTITDTLAPTLEIATAGMSIVNAKIAGAITYSLNAECLDSAGNHVKNSGCATSNNNFTDVTNMNHNGGGAVTGVEHINHFGNHLEHEDYINGQDTHDAYTNWHGQHEHAESQKGMNSHYHDETNAAFLKDITDGTTASVNHGGKLWKVDAGVVELRNHGGDMEISTVGEARGVQDSYVIQHSSGFDADEDVITNLVKAHKGFACYDTCDGDLTHAMTNGVRDNGLDLATSATNGVTMQWHHTDCDGAEIAGFNTLVPGTYALKYVCTDQCGNSASKCRTILNEDHTKPVLTVLEADDQTYEATREDNYVDAGATCSDEVDGNISQDVEVSGDVVNLARVGVYTIKYNCEDSASNPADEATRKVTVQDTSCPTCVLSVDGTRATTHDPQGDHIVSIEASFPYSDVGAVAQDTLQGSFGICSVWSDGTMEASYKNIVNVEATGTYFITYRVKDSNGNWNDDSSCSEGQTDGTVNARENIRTVVIIDTLRPVIELKYKGSTGVDEQVIHRGAQEFAAGVAGAPRGAGIHGGDADTYTHEGAVHDGGLWNRQVAGDHSVARTTDAENHDTYTPSLMAEESATTAVNGWVIGAVASAVSGLALLGYSLRKSAAPVATSVPV